MIVCFDTETTGVSEYDELLQVTVIDDNEKILLETYLRPQRMMVWKEAEKVNHITYDMVKDAPNPVDIKDQLQDIFNKAEKIIGYNTMFDVGFVERCCGVTIDRDKIVDCLKNFRDECRKKSILIPHHKLGDAVDYYCPEAKEDYLSNAHDASCDAIATMRVYLASIDPDKTRNVPRIKPNESAVNLLNILQKPRSKQLTEQEIKEIADANGLDEIDTAKVRDYTNEQLKDGLPKDKAIQNAMDRLHAEYDQMAKEAAMEKEYESELS